MKILVMACFCMSSVMSAMDPRASEVGESLSLEETSKRILILEAEVKELKQQSESSKNRMDGLESRDATDQQTVAGLVKGVYDSNEKLPKLKRRLSSLEKIVRQPKEEQK